MLYCGIVSHFGAWKVKLCPEVEQIFNESDSSFLSGSNSRTYMWNTIIIYKSVPFYFSRSIYVTEKRTWANKPVRFDRIMNHLVISYSKTSHLLYCENLSNNNENQLDWEYKVEYRTMQRSYNKNSKGNSVINRTD